MEKYFIKSVLVIGAIWGATVWASASPQGLLIAGPDSATVVIEEYADFECKYCAIGSNTIKQVLKDYCGQVKLVFRNLPLPFHSGAMTAAKAFTAVWLQSPSLAYSYQEELFDHQAELIAQGETFLYATATKLGVDVAKMKSDMGGDVVARMISDDQQLADSHGFKGTPSFMIGTEPVSGAIPYAEFKKILDKQLGH